MCHNNSIKISPVIHMCKTMIVIPNTVNVSVQDHYVSITGVLGTLVYKLHKSIIAQLRDDMGNLVIYTSSSGNSMNKALIGTTNALINKMIIGVTQGFIKKLQLIGIGYRVSVTNDIISLIIGLSHSVNYKLPVKVTAMCPNQTEIILTSIDKQLIGQVAADLRSIQPPEPFKGKGIRYIDEVVRNKDTKKR